jgi:hypothetical protein
MQWHTPPLQFYQRRYVRQQKQNHPSQDDRPLPFGKCRAQTGTSCHKLSSWARLMVHGLPCAPFLEQARES